MATELLERRSVTPSRLSAPGTIPTPSSARRTVTPSPVQLYSSLQPPLEITCVAFSSKQSAEESHTQRFRLPACSAIIRRGNTLILKISTSVQFSSSYTVTLTFVPVFRPQDRFGQFKAQGFSRGGSKELWLSVDVPANFPVGKFHAHLSLSLKGRPADVVTHFHPSPIVVLFNPWNPDDDAYLEDLAALEEYVLSDVGVIWRGTSSHMQHTRWEFGQFEEHCLDVALYLLHSLTADECRSVCSVSRGVVSSLHSRDQTGVLAVAAGGKGGRFAAGGMHPCRWNGSPAVLQRFHRTRTPVRYASCWVFTGVAVTLLRALGIPSRPVTCYNAAHHCARPGQLDRHFSTEGELLGDVGQDQLWVYHVWCEAWMRRDDLPTGYDGWQVLDATSQPKQSGHYRTGPASVRAIREGRSGDKKWPYSNQVIISEVSADTRYIRVSKSYGSCSNSTFTVAQVQHGETGTLIVTSSPNDTPTHPLDITAHYKELLPMATPSVAEKTASRFPAPSRDCTFDVSTNEGATLGEDVIITISIANKGAMLRTLDGRVVGKVIRYTGHIVHSFMSMQFKGIVSPGQSASVSLPIEAKKYSRQLLVEQGLLQFFVAIKARESKQLFLKVQPFRVCLPSSLEVLCPARVAEGEAVRVTLRFRNTLQCSLSRVLLLVQAQSLLAQRELTHRRLVLPGRLLVVKCQTRAVRTGCFTILASLHCDQLTDVRGTATITVLPRPSSSSTQHS